MEIPALSLFLGCLVLGAATVLQMNPLADPDLGGWSRETKKPQERSEVFECLPSRALCHYDGQAPCRRVIADGYMGRVRWQSWLCRALPT